MKKDETILHDNMFNLMSKIKCVEGCVIELGVASGNNAIIIGKFLKNLNKKYYGFDTFSGYTKQDIEEARENREGLVRNQESGRWNIDHKEVIHKIKSSGLSKTCEIIVGDIKQTVPNFIDNNTDLKVAMVYIDCNAYLPAITALNALKESLSPGALIVVDEHTVGGESRAYKEFMPSNCLTYSVADNYKQGPRVYGIWKE